MTTPTLREALARLVTWAESQEPGVQFSGDHPIALGRAALSAAAPAAPAVPHREPDYPGEDVAETRATMQRLFGATAPQAQQPGVAYAELPEPTGWLREPYICSGSGGIDHYGRPEFVTEKPYSTDRGVVPLIAADQMHVFADATCALRVARAGAQAVPSDAEILNRTGCIDYSPGTAEYDLELIRWYRRQTAAPAAVSAPQAPTEDRDGARFRLLTGKSLQREVRLLWERGAFMSADRVRAGLDRIAKKGPPRG